MSPRCTIIRLDLRDLARAAEDPKLSALLAEGWRPIAHVAIQEDDGAPTLAIVLAPPSPPMQTIIATAPVPSIASALAVAVAALAVGVAIGAIGQAAVTW